MLAVGQICVWYPHAETNQHPQAAIVTEVKQRDVYVMFVFPKGGGTPVQKTNVHHVDSDFLLEKPNMRVLYGGWDSIEAAELRRVKGEEESAARQLKAAEESKSAARREQETARITVLADRGFESKEIAKKMGKDWTIKQVEKVVEQHKEAQPAQ